VPAVLDDPALRRRLTRVYVECRESYTETAKVLGLDKHIVRRLLRQPCGPIPKTRSRVEHALNAYEARIASSKQTLNLTETHPLMLPELAEEVLRYVLQAVEAQRAGSGQQ
jgi:hypothetical protein